MSFRPDWINAGAAVALGTLFSVACRTPGEGWQESSAVESGGAANNAATTSTVSSDTSAVAASSMGGASAAATTDDGSTSDGAPQTSTADGSSTTDAGSTTDVGSTTDTGSTSGTGGGSSSDSGTNTTGSGGGGNGSNLIVNGDFSSSEDPCTIDESDWFTEGTLNWSGADDVICAYCIVMDPDQSGQLNWSGNSGTPPTLDGGTSYRFSFDVWAPEGETIPTLSAKVGQPVDPYTGFLEEDVTVTNSQANQSFTFTMDSSDQAGIAFFLSSPGAWSKICIDNVTLEPQ